MLETALPVERLGFRRSRHIRKLTKKATGKLSVQIVVTDVVTSSRALTLANMRLNVLELATYAKAISNS